MGIAASEQVVTRADIPFSRLGWVGWAMASRSVWPDSSVVSPAFALYFARSRRGSAETMVAMLPWVGLAALAIALREVIFAGPTPPPFLVEWRFWASAALIQAIAAPALGVGQSLMVSRAMGLYLPMRTREELSLCPNVSAGDLVYGVGARLASSNGLGVLLWFAMVSSAAHWHLLGDLAGQPFNGAAMLALNILNLYAAYVTRVFSDHGIATAIRWHFFVPDPSLAMGRTIKAYFFWAPIRFIAAPVVLIGLVVALAMSDALLLVLPVLLAFPLVMGAVAALTEQSAARMMESTVEYLRKTGIAGAQD